MTASSVSTRPEALPAAVPASFMGNCREILVGLLRINERGGMKTRIVPVFLLGNGFPTYFLDVMNERSKEWVNIFSGRNRYRVEQRRERIVLDNRQGAAVDKSVYLAESVDALAWQQAEELPATTTYD